MPKELMDTPKVKELASALRFESDPKEIFEKTSRTLAEKSMEHMSFPELQDLAFAVGVGSQYTVAEAVDHRFAPLAVSFTRQLIEEYGCNTPSQIAVAEVVATSYARYIEHSKLMKTYKRDGFVHKAVDRSQRQFISALGALRQMKAPPISVKVTAQNAFVAQNQVNPIINKFKQPYESK
jgi:hypothetical protein